MSGETEKNVSGWTIDTYAAFQAHLRAADDRYHAERDRRYTEVKNAEEKALRIKEQADRDALSLAREIQTYKDEKANELREQISSERGLYATKNDLAAAAEKLETELRPIQEYISTARGRGDGGQSFKVESRANMTLIIAVILMVLALLRGAGKI